MPLLTSPRRDHLIQYLCLSSLPRGETTSFSICASPHFPEARPPHSVFGPLLTSPRRDHLIQYLCLSSLPRGETTSFSTCATRSSLPQGETTSFSTCATPHFPEARPPHSVFGPLLTSPRRDHLIQYFCVSSLPRGETTSFSIWASSLPRGETTSFSISVSPHFPEARPPHSVFGPLLTSPRQDHLIQYLGLFSLPRGETTSFSISVSSLPRGETSLFGFSPHSSSA